MKQRADGLFDLDTRDVDRWIGKPLGGGRLKDPVVPNDLRRWAQGRTWEAKDRDIKPDATVHPSVDERFRLASVVQCDGAAPYRPTGLAHHVRFRPFYGDPVAAAAEPSRTVETGAPTQGQAPDDRGRGTTG